MKKISTLLIFMIIFMQFSIAQETEIVLEDPGVLPDSPLYSIKKFGEKLSLSFSFSETSKTEKQMRYAERRVAEAKAMVEKGKSEYVPGLLTEYEAGIDQTITSTANDRALEATAKHFNVLSSLYDKVPDEAKPAIAHATAASANGHSRIASGLGEETSIEFNENASEEARTAIGEAVGEAIPGMGIAIEPPVNARIGPRKTDKDEPIETGSSSDSGSAGN